ncbi:GAF and ANTAR domain-containing protein [Microbacterium sp. cf046]|uniref:GAF and ANTAR domain-containing protein n=1 Tax=Microbacterium sp. cf046 TaxID=1761803 RepID=UPI0020C88C79|nr:GAF and ANTAR domain-containing protein [Microbacterium sp. cf046]
MDTLENAPDQPERYCGAFLSVLPVAGAAVSTIGHVLGSETIAASDSQAARIDEIQFDLGEGPCWDAMRSATPVLEPAVGTAGRERWPAFAQSIVPDGVNSVFAFPLAIGPLRFGAVDLYSRIPVSLSDTQAHQAEAMAEIVSRHVLRRALASIGDDANEPVSAFSRRLIHQATGVVLAQVDISADDARLMIQGQAFAAGRPMMEVAQDIIDGRLRFIRAAGRIEVAL